MPERLVIALIQCCDVIRRRQPIADESGAAARPVRTRRKLVGHSGDSTPGPENENLIRVGVTKVVASPSDLASHFVMELSRLGNPLRPQHQHGRTTHLQPLRQQVSEPMSDPATHLRRRRRRHGGRSVHPPRFPRTTAEPSGSEPVTTIRPTSSLKWNSANTILSVERSRNSTSSLPIATKRISLKANFTATLRGLRTAQSTEEIPGRSILHPRGPGRGSSTRPSSKPLFTPSTIVGFQAPLCLLNSQGCRTLIELTRFSRFGIF